MTILIAVPISLLAPTRLADYTGKQFERKNIDELDTLPDIVSQLLNRNNLAKTNRHITQKQKRAMDDLHSSYKFIGHCPLSWRRDRITNPILSVALSSETYISKFACRTSMGYDLECFTVLTLASCCSLLSCI